MHLLAQQPQCRYTNQLTAMTAQLLIPARAASIQSTPIDFKMAMSILDRLGYCLQDLSLEYGNVCIGQDDISHQLYYGTEYSTSNIMGYVYSDNDMYYASGNHWVNHHHAECAALDLLDRAIVEDCKYAIELERAMAPDYN